MALPVLVFRVLLPRLLHSSAAQVSSSLTLGPNRSISLGTSPAMVARMKPPPRNRLYRIISSRMSLGSRETTKSTSFLVSMLDLLLELFDQLLQDVLSFVRALRVGTDGGAARIDLDCDFADQTVDNGIQFGILRHRDRRFHHAVLAAG